MLEAALTYREQGLSVIPLKKDKRPLISWLPYQQKRASDDEIREWWNKYPSANVGIVTGAISGIVVLDCDSDEAIRMFREKYTGLTPAVKTPRGMHFYFKYEEGVRNTVKIGNLDMDIRGEGGYVVAPPSINEEGVRYAWHLDFISSALDSFSTLKDSFSFFLYRENVEFFVESGSQNSTESTKLHKYFTQGRRDEDLFHVANAMVKGGAKLDVIKQTLKMIALSCNPPFPEKDIDAKIQSALERSRRRERNIAQEVEDFVNSTNGLFNSTECRHTLQYSTKEEIKNLSMVLSRLAKKGIIKKEGNRNGHWRKVDNDPVEFMDFINVSTDDVYDFKLPLGIHKKTMIFPKAIIILAGVTGFGKTSWMLNIIRDNMHKYDCYYFNSEISALGLNKKLSYFNYPIDQWKMKVVPDDRWDYNNIADRIYPDAVNVIDYLEPDGDKPFNIHGVITNISKKLNKGIALIAVQKNPDKEMGVGGTYSARASSLYLALDWGRIKIVKNRYREEDPHPGLIMRDFKIASGQSIKSVQGWYSEQSKRQADKVRTYADNGIEVDDNSEADDVFVPEEE
ncbi:MAG: bifunctional DNA primase/polymerase [Syntrophaceae bacterium]